MKKLISLKNTVAPHKGDFVLYLFEVVRLHDVIYDEETDEYYWVFEKLGGDFELVSCAINWNPLTLNRNTYKDMMNLWTINNSNNNENKKSLREKYNISFSINF